MQGISDNTLQFFLFIRNEYEGALNHDKAMPLYDDKYDDMMLMDNILLRMDTDRPTAVLTEEDLKFIDHVFAEHRKVIEEGDANLWEANVQDEYITMSSVRSELEKVHVLQDTRWMTYEVFSGTYQVIPYLAEYESNSNLYVGLDSFDTEFGGMTPFTSVTTNIITLPYLHAAIDVGNNGDQIKRFLEENNFGKFTDLNIPSGFNLYPVFRFDEHKLMEIDPEGFKNYARSHGRDISTLEGKIRNAETTPKSRTGEHVEGRGEPERST